MFEKVFLYIFGHHSGAFNILKVEFRSYYKTFFLFLNSQEKLEWIFHLNRSFFPALQSLLDALRKNPVHGLEKHNPKWT